MSQESNVIGQQDSWSGRAELAWAGLAFAEPQPGSTLIAPVRGGEKLEPEAEYAFYADFQTRDSELGLALIDERKFELIKTTSMVRAALAKRVRAASMARTRYQALESINAGEPNPALRYPEKVFTELQAELNRLTMELVYLQAFGARIDSLHTLLTRLLNEPEGGASPEMEQTLRLLGQSWRGQMRIRAWSDRIPMNARRRPALTAFQPDYMNFAGYIVAVPGNDESLIITSETGAYLVYLLEVIVHLARETERFLSDKSRAKDTWYPMLTLVRAVIEFFYYCNFELPYAYGNHVLDGAVSDKVWTYQGQWIASGDDPQSVRRLKRMGAEVTSLLIKHDRLLQCQTEEELAELLKSEARPLNAGVPSRMLYQPYWSVGLAGFEFSQGEQRVHFHTLPETIGGLIASLIVDQEQLECLASSRMGGPLETILGLALLDERAFPSASMQLETRTRYELLARFWRSVGRRRAIIMMGDYYVQQVSEALSVLGQPGPEHPTFLTVRFSSMHGTLPSAASGRSEAGPVQADSIDPFAALVMADQIRIVELLNLTWSFSEQFLDNLTQATARGGLPQVIRDLPATTTGFVNDLKLRINESWLISLDPLWTLVRNSAPVLWDFWSKVKHDEDWQRPLRSAAPPDAAGLMLRLLADNVRLLVLVELSGTMMLAKLRFNSEQAATALYRAAAPYQAADPEHITGIAQMVDYYFDDTRFDIALAFVSAFRQHMAMISDDLRRLDADENTLAVFQGVVAQLDRNYSMSGRA